MLRLRSFGVFGHCSVAGWLAFADVELELVGVVDYVVQFLGRLVLSKKHQPKNQP